ncbi:Uma2 family endonuclease [Crocosphaera sp. UHCC 0190]|uniref:Uma2 family endonuclease n=1 Tax=Crocosphaera sp. UHCC 0190 TaxID=3110246 RepID=UPI002B20222E|nr:Uma2 family endonuclease [Crocosphaera sp. UHCC 0190]MEA5509531.1 Uma2 family endonuclease [Crocosphaera sp. UHCC 0190]
MIYQFKNSQEFEITYPDSDGKPMSDNTIQFRWITMIKSNLDWLFANNDNVFIAGDLLWYPLEGSNKLRQAPDVMIVFGRPKGDRGSYQQWKEKNIAPQVVFEILSPGNTQTEMTRKLLFYDRYGVEEYYIYDPDKNDLNGLQRIDNRLETIENIDNWISPRLGIRFEIGSPELCLYYPDDQPFQSYVEIAQRLQESEAKLIKEHFRVQEEHERAEKLAAKLRELGINPDDI